MSKPRYSWYGFVKNIIRKYPDKNLPHENAAVDAAIVNTMHLNNGETRMKLVQMVLFDHSFTLDHAAQILFLSERTAQRYHADFIREVGKCFRCDSLMGEGEKG